jgi:hypothetical protein
MAIWRSLAVGVGVLLLAAPLRAQTYPLAEAPRAGDCLHCTLALQVSGELKVMQGGKPVPLKLAATAGQEYHEKLMLVSPEGQPQKAARRYAKAAARIAVADSTQDKALRPERALAVAQRQDGRYLCYSPQGPLTPDELSIVAEHLDTLAVAGLLPGKEVPLGGTWTIANTTVWALCAFDGLLAQDLAGKLEEVKDGTAVFSITGNASGIEKGALVKVAVTATGRFDLAGKRLTALEWKQKDQREQGPASPASVVESTCTLSRAVATEPAELSPEALAGVPEGLEAPPGLLNLSLRDQNDRYEVVFGRDWQVVARTGEHLVLRLLERGDFLAQVTITPWKKAEPGKHLSLDEFRQLLLNTPGFELEDLAKPSESVEGGRTVCRLEAVGQLDGVRVVQNYYLVAHPTGEQVILAFTMKPQAVAKVGGRDVAIVQGISFPAAAAEKK